jgi:hypothetical protein
MVMSAAAAAAAAAGCSIESAAATVVVQDDEWCDRRDYSRNAAIAFVPCYMIITK